MDKKRLVYFDFVKGIGIILMIMGHIGFSECFDIAIHSFHMPLFFVVSGYFYKKDNIVVRIIKKARMLLVPYVFWGLFNFFIYFVIRLVNEGWDIHHCTALVRLFSWNNQGLGIADALWFLTALFFCDLIYTSLQKSRYCYFLTFMISILFLLISNYTTIRLPWSINAACVALVFYSVGNVMAADEKFQALWRNLIIDLGAIFFAVPLVMINGHVNLRSGVCGNIILFYIDAILISVAICGISYNIYHFFYGVPVVSTFYKVISKIGNASLTYMAINQVSIKCIDAIFTNEENCYYKICQLIALLLIIYFIHSIIDDSKFRFVLGKLREIDKTTVVK